MDKHPFFSHLRCRECGRHYAKEAVHVCEFDFGPLEAAYDYEAIGKALTREKILSRPRSMWRYRELLPIENEPTVGLQTGFTPLIRARRLAEHLGVDELYIKNDTVNYPTLSFKDRVVAVALSRAKELGIDTVACASTGNLANSVAANAAAAGLRSFVLIPADLEPTKILGSLIFGTNVIGIQGAYDQVNRLCSQIAGKFHWGFVNVNLRPYYAEGSKTVGYEIAEQLGWRLPDNIVCPMAGGSLITKIRKAFNELVALGLVEEKKVKFFRAQATACSPISDAVKRKLDQFEPQKPQTIARSLAIGNPADGYYASRTIRDSGGCAEDISDPEIVKGIQLLAETEGIFAETAGGVTTGVTKKLIEQGYIGPNETTVVCITGNGLKTIDAVWQKYSLTPAIAPRLTEFEAFINDRMVVAAAK